MRTTALEMTDIDVVIAYEDISEEMFAECLEWASEKKDRWVALLVQDKDFFSPEVLSHPQLRLYRLSPGEEDLLFKKLSWDFVFLRVTFLPTSKGKAYFERLGFYQTSIHLLASEYADLGEKLLHNFFANQKHVHISKSLKELKGAYRGIPAVICGAGVSLEEQTQEVQSLTNEAVVLAGGSAIKVCSELGITPHFGLHFDPDPPYERFKDHSLFEVPLIWQCRFSSRLLDLVHGEKWVTPASEGYLLDELIFKETLDSGWVVANYAVQVAHYLGCDPIILVGVDLCTSKQRMYAKGVNEEMEKLLVCKNQKGEECYTKSDWLLAAKWLEEFASGHPEKTFYNASSGLEIKGFTPRQLKEIKGSSYDIAGVLHACLQMSESNITDDVKVQIKDSFLRMEKIFEGLFFALAKAFEDRSLQKGEIILLESDLEEEIAYQTIVLPVWNVWKHVFARNFSAEHEFNAFLNKILFFQKIVEVNKKGPLYD